METGEGRPQDPFLQRVEKALASPEIPTVYFNGFLNTLGSGDILIVLERNGRPVANLHTSYTVAKTLAMKLGQMIAELEAKTGNTIMTTDDVNEAMLRKDTTDDN